jgi:hypothetical protein
MAEITILLPSPLEPQGCYSRAIAYSSRHDECCTMPHPCWSILVTRAGAIAGGCVECRRFQFMPRERCAFHPTRSLGPAGVIHERPRAKHGVPRFRCGHDASRTMPGCQEYAVSIFCVVLPQRHHPRVHFCEVIFNGVDMRDSLS